MEMDADGTASDPARYIIGENGRYDRDFGGAWLTVGEVNSWNSLIVQNGSVVTSTGGIEFGGTQGSHHNSVIVDAATLLVSYLDVGFYGDRNRLEVLSGGLVQSESSYIGYAPTYGYPPVVNGGNENELVVSGANTLLTMTNSIDVGFYGSRNKLIVEDGGTVRIGSSLTIGAADLASGNQTLVTGKGSLLEVGSSGSMEAQLGIGFGGSQNALLVEDGGTVNVLGVIEIGRAGSSDGKLVVSGTNSSLQAESIEIGTVLDVMATLRGQGNMLRVEDGAQVTLSDRLVIGRPNGQDNEVIVSGRNSILYVEGEIAFGDGLPGSTGDGTNLLTVEDGGLVNVGFLFVDPSACEGENTIRLNGGYIAWFGDNLDGLSELLNDGLIQVWNPETDLWENALGSAYFSFGYFDSDEAALAFSGYEGLGGYTIFTSMVPEPSAYAMLIGVTTIGLVAVRRSRMTKAK